MKITNAMSATTKVTIFDRDDVVQAVPLPGGVFEVAGGQSVNFAARRPVLVKFFAPGLVDRHLATATAGASQDVTISDGGRVAVQGGTPPPPKRDLLDIDLPTIDEIVGGDVAAMIAEIESGRVAAERAIADPISQQRIHAAFERDRDAAADAIENAQKRLPDLLGDPGFNAKLARLSDATRRNDTAAVRSAGTAILQDPRMGAINYPFSGLGLDTYVTGFSTSLELLLGVSFGRGSSMKSDDTEQNTYTSLGPSLGIQAGGHVGWEFGWYTPVPAELGGWVVGESISLGMVAGVNITGWYTMGDQSHQVGMTITVGLGVEAALGWVWAHTWVP